MAKEFKKNIRQYNAAFAFTSLGVKIDERVIEGSGPYSFQISGELHHCSGALLPQPEKSPVFAQIYIHDPQTQLHFCQSNNPNLNSVIMTQLQDMITQTHPYASLYKQAYDIMKEKPQDEQQNIYMRL